MKVSDARILIVDPNKSDVLKYKSVFNKLGCEVLVTDKGIKAMDLVEDEKFDLILLEAILPDFNGFELCRRINSNEKTKFLPVVMVTKLARTEDKVKALNLGANDFISKPINEDELEARVLSLLQIRRDQKKSELEKWEFTALFVHDMRNSLSSIVSFLKMLQGNSLDKDKKKQLHIFDIMNSSAFQMLGLINNIFFISQKEMGKIDWNFYPMRLNNAIEMVMRQIQPVAEINNLKIKSNILEPVVVNIDEHKIGQLLINLFINAIKLSNDGGVINLNMRKKGSILTVSISHTGEAIDPDEIPFLFDIIPQHKIEINKKIGTILGWSVSKQIIDAHRGKMNIESQKGKGNKFSFSLPIHEESE